MIYEHREQAQVLYVIPVSSILGRLPLVPVMTYHCQDSNPRSHTSNPDALPTRATVLKKQLKSLLFIPQYTFYAYYSAYNLAYFAYFTYSAWKHLHQHFTVYWHYCMVPHPRAQLFTYHHLHPSPLFADLSHDAPGKSADSRRMAKGIVPVAPTGTRGRRPRMEDTGITYKTCACSRRS